MHRGCISLAAAVLLSGGLLAAPARAQESTPSDPLETWNRAVHSFNEAVGASALGHITDAYRTSVPSAVRTGIDNVFVNLREPLTAVSSGLKGDFGNAGISAGRFAVNTTIGLGGVFDVATELDLVARPEDLGTAMCGYDIPPGPYLVLPFIGPTTTRHAVGRVAAYVATFGVLEELALPYLFADRWVSLGDEGAADEAAGGDSYAADKARYLELRRRLCAEELPAEKLKASPFGSVIEARESPATQPGGSAAEPRAPAGGDSDLEI